ncbi:hypothetical protein BP6252_02585 [Coleophoma cylindrospora]|uniref:Uncharacterized protein n=1 Tax=Coleophoma cylindrospora TaxID=1849047 RepID=A0A3D8SF79_9HELO|nr:hypothetical protein BP6252_02585 [Coleophoma cylindrospora]
MFAQTPSAIATGDPAHPDQPNNDHTTTSGEKPKTAFQAIMDPEFLPTLESAPKTQHIKSYIILISLVIGGVVGAWFFGFELFQVASSKDPQVPFTVPEPRILASSWIELVALLGLVIAGLLLLISWTGALWIDWWELVLGYWWLRYVVSGIRVVLDGPSGAESANWPFDRSMPAAGGAVVCLVMMQETASSMNEVS